MCGIIGITGRDDALSEIVAGLTRLEYRGYDSAGVVMSGDGGVGGALPVVKRAGKLANLREALDERPLHGRVGIGHTRWATHGAPTDDNAHPHTDPSGRIAVVHNGIIENYQALRASLARQGGPRGDEPQGGPRGDDPDRAWASQTDTEVVAHLAGEIYDRHRERHGEADLLAVVQEVVGRLEGAFSLCFLHVDEPETIVVARRESPLIVAHADGVGYCASDVTAMIAHTRHVCAPEDGHLARITPHGIEVVDEAGAPVELESYEVTWDVSAAEKQGYEHFMRKEIHEQPQAVRETLRDRLEDGRLHLDELRVASGAGREDVAPGTGREDVMGELARIDKVFAVACGTPLHAGMVGKYAIEHWAHIPVEVEVASEFRYRDPILTPHTLVIAVSQSGETSDTIAAARHASDQRAPVLALTNVVGSSLARQADGVLYTHAGPEIAVASTKAFTTQLVALLVLGMFLGQERGALFTSECEDIPGRLQQLPEAIEATLELDGDIQELAKRYCDVGYTMFIGRHAGLPIAYEGALKLKEISYLHAEAFPAGEMKHGPIALIEQGSLVVALATQGHVLSKMISNIQEVRARGASVLALGSGGSTADLAEHADHLLTLPEASHELAAPILAAVPLQLFAYHVAILRGEDVDQPRNLAKTVTVE